jgi:hypothetical protein
MTGRIRYHYCITEISDVKTYDRDKLNEDMKLIFAAGYRITATSGR